MVYYTGAFWLVADFHWLAWQEVSELKVKNFKPVATNVKPPVQYEDTNLLRCTLSLIGLQGVRMIRHNEDVYFTNVMSRSRI